MCQVVQRVHRFKRDVFGVAAISLFLSRCVTTVGGAAISLFYRDVFDGAVTPFFFFIALCLMVQRFHFFIALCLAVQRFHLFLSRCVWWCSDSTVVFFSALLGDAAILLFYRDVFVGTAIPFFF